MTDTGHSTGRRSGGRAGRAAMRAAHVIERVPYLTRTMQPFEIVDARTRDWRIAGVELVADNAINAGFVLGPERPAGDLDPAGVSVMFGREGDRLYARETWRPVMHGHSSHIEYAAEGPGNCKNIVGDDFDGSGFVAPIFERMRTGSACFSISRSA